MEELHIPKATESDEYREVEPPSPLTPVTQKKKNKTQKADLQKAEGVGIPSVDVRKMVGNQSEESLQQVYATGFELVAVDDWKQFQELITQRLRKQRLLSRNYLRVFTQKTSWLISIWTKIKDVYEHQSEGLIQGLRSAATEFSVWKNTIPVVSNANPDSPQPSSLFGSHVTRLVVFRSKAETISDQLLRLCTRIESTVHSQLSSILTRENLQTHQEALRQAFESLSSAQAESYRLISSCETPPQGMEMMAFGLSSRNPYHQEFRLVSLMRRVRELLGRACVDSLTGIHNQMQDCLEEWAGQLQTSLEEFESMAEQLFVGWRTESATSEELQLKDIVEQRYPIIKRLKQGMEMVSQVEAEHALLIKSKLQSADSTKNDEVDIQDISDFFEYYPTPYPKITHYILQSLLVARGKWDSADLLLMSVDVAFG